MFPYELCKRVIQYYSYKNDLVFDPFAGSGTVGKTAKSLGRYFSLTGKDKKYFLYIKNKMNVELVDAFPPRFLSLDEFKVGIK